MANIYPSHAPKNIFAVLYLITAIHSLIHKNRALIHGFRTHIHNLQKFGTRAKAKFTHPVRKNYDQIIWLGTRENKI